MTVLKVKDIIKVPLKELLAKLTTAYVDELGATYQYWVGAKIIQGSGRTTVASELNTHAQEELSHAESIATRIIQLGGQINIYPQDWHKKAGCHYKAISSTKIITVLKENLKGEQCAIEFYNGLLNFTQGKDHVTYSIIEKILEDELEHEQDIITLLEEI
jgi:bacterioferritin